METNLKKPKSQGLYLSSTEKDACGIGFIAQIKGKKSHNIVSDSLEMLNRLTHRGACGCEENTGDGAGVLLQIPHLFFKEELHKQSIDLPEFGEYAVGMVYVNPKQAEKIKSIYEEVILQENQEILTWREVPTNNELLGATAKAGEPKVLQIFIKKSPQINDNLSFERKLYLIRKQVENKVNELTKEEKDKFFIVSFSSNTIVYKGMLLSEQVSEYYPELKDSRVVSAFALVHSRFATNTFPSWDRAHPNRMLAHNGEINTIRGNYNWMYARQNQLVSDIFGDDIHKIFPILNQDGSDSAIFDNCLEFLVLGGRSLSEALMMMVPEPWYYNKDMDDKKKAFYEYHSCLMEPWDGPASLVATDGKEIVAVLDRNGLRPSRYWITDDDCVIMSSEVGVCDVETHKIVRKGRLEPGRMFKIDLEQKEIERDEVLKDKISSKQPYRQWINDNLLTLKDLTPCEALSSLEGEQLHTYQKAFNYTTEDKTKMILEMAQLGKDPIGSMGNDTPLAPLSRKHPLLYTYFKQLFAQVTNPPIDAIREELVTATDLLLGNQKNILDPQPQNAQLLRLDHPIIDSQSLAKIKNSDNPIIKSKVLDILYSVDDLGKGLEKALDDLFLLADQAIEEGYTVLILSDRNINQNQAAIPALLAIGGLHHYLIRKGTRNLVGLVLETGEAREVHHFCTLIGYGCAAINPYLALDTIQEMLVTNNLTDQLSLEKAQSNYLKAANQGMVKVISKMGISTIASYHGAQIFEILGLKQSLVDKYFTWTPTRIEGKGLEELAEGIASYHREAFHQDFVSIDPGGKLHWRKNGEYHLFNPNTIHYLQKATANNDYEIFKKYSAEVNDHDKNHSTIRSLLEFQNEQPIALDEVESVESILKRFKTGAISYGSISSEAHETMAIAMNTIGGKSNTGEGGEDPKRFKLDENGHNRRSAIKQVASGRFGVTSHYLTNADEIQIKMAQGAKPGEGGHLPGKKVYPWIAKVRGSTPGVELISPPPHHDIYSIEDLAQLIYDLKNANRSARISVKLVSEVGVGTVASGVTKAKADVILISGHDGGTGASPQTSIYNAGLPWELGVAETHQTLLLNNLRDRVAIETDGQLKTGRDVAIAALLGAEEFGFATAPLVVMGCIMMRKCHLGTCPVGIATQNPELRKKFTGNPDSVISFMRFVAQELREIMAQLGFRTLNEMVGRIDKLKLADKGSEYRGINLDKLLFRPDVPSTVGTYCDQEQNHGLDKTIDQQVLLKAIQPALDSSSKVSLELNIKNTDRAVGTIIGNEVSKKYEATGLPEDTIQLKFKGSAGQSLGAFTPSGITFELEGDANDYLGKGLSGSKIIVYPPKDSPFKAEDNVIIGNVAFYGATGGQAYIRGIAGERFCVRNSGVETVVEGVGDHGCEYMTGGRVIVLGDTGHNFAAGMSGGLAFVWDKNKNFKSKCNLELIDLYSLEQEDKAYILKMLENHFQYTDSPLAQEVLENPHYLDEQFIKIFPRHYKEVLEAQKQAEQKGLKGEEALLFAFEQSIS